MRLQCPLLAQSGHGLVRCKCPLLGAKRTCRFALQMSAYDPKRTLSWSHNQADAIDVAIGGKADMIFNRLFACR
jgi:hypothetical protein